MKQQIDKSIVTIGNKTMKPILQHTKNFNNAVNGKLYGMVEWEHELVHSNNF